MASVWAVVGCWAFDVGCWMFPRFIGRAVVWDKRRARQRECGWSRFAQGSEALELDPVGVGGAPEPGGRRGLHADGLGVAIGEVELVGGAVAAGRQVPDAVVRAHIDHEEGVVDSGFVFVDEVPKGGGLADLIFGAKQDVGQGSVLLGRGEVGAADGVAIALAIHPGVHRIAADDGDAVKVAPIGGTAVNAVGFDVGPDRAVLEGIEICATILRSWPVSEVLRRSGAPARAPGTGIDRVGARTQGPA